MSFRSLHSVVALSVSRTAELRPDARAHTHANVRAHTQVSTLSLVFLNIKPQKDYLNMNSVCLCYEWRRCTVLFTTCTEARVMLPVILASH